MFQPQLCNNWKQNVWLASTHSYHLMCAIYISTSAISIGRVDMLLCKIRILLEKHWGMLKHSFHWPSMLYIFVHLCRLSQSQFTVAKFPLNHVVLINRFLSFLKKTISRHEHICTPAPQTYKNGWCEQWGNPVKTHKTVVNRRHSWSLY